MNKNVSKSNGYVSTTGRIIFIILSVVYACFLTHFNHYNPISSMKSTVQTEIENTPYDSLNSHKTSDNVSMDVVVNDATHKQVFITVKKPKYEYQVIVSKNNDGSSGVRPFVN